jgi:hypothetical protein
MHQQNRRLWIKFCTEFVNLVIPGIAKNFTGGNIKQYIGRILHKRQKAKHLYAVAEELAIFV